MSVKRVFIGSTNPIKAAAAKTGFKAVFPNQNFDFFEFSVPSNVSSQPMTDEETLRGATNRLKHLEEIGSSDFCVTMEGGISRVDNKMMTFAWILVSSKGKTGRSRTASVFLPDQISLLVDEGYELGDADDIVFKQSGSKKDKGGVGILTNNLITRADLYSPSVILALVPFLNPNLFD